MKWFLALSMFLPLPALTATNELTVYSVYDAERMAPIFKPFTDRTGIKVNVVSGSSTELADRLEKEGADSPADLVLDKDIVYLSAAQKKGLFRPFMSTTIEKTVPSHLIETGRNWFLILYRARVIVYNRNRVSPAELSTYKALGDAQWRGRLCLRTSNNSYNEALAGSFVNHLGAEAAYDLFGRWVSNLALDPIKGDTDLIKAIANEQCDLGIANTYYLAPLIKADPNYPVRPFFPNQGTTGAHVNGVGMGLTRFTKNEAAATQLLEYMVSKEVQAPVAGGFFQYPVNSEAPMARELVDFGAFHQDTTNAGTVGELAPAGKELMQKAQYK